MESKLVGIILISLVLVSKIHLLLAIKSYNFSPAVLEMYEIKINSAINSHYVRTTIVKKLENKGETQQNITYSVVFPEEAYITGFILEADGKNHTAYVTGRKVDQNNQSATNISSELKGITQRDCNSFSLPISVKPGAKIAFYLSYEQLLERRKGLYEHVINIHTEQPIPFFNIEVTIDEKSSLVYLNATTRICNKSACKEIPVEADELTKHSNDKAIVRPNLSVQKQNHFMAYSNSNESTQGFTGQFIVQYDVERNTTSGQILTNDGYCVHFFAPTELPPMSKYVVFVLDTSLSMKENSRMDLLKHAMCQIIEKMHHNDLFSIVEFNTVVKVWGLDKDGVYYPSRAVGYDPVREVDFKKFRFPKAYQVNKENIEKAKGIINKFQEKKQTNIYSALRVGLHLVELSRDQINNSHPFIVFLTDGEQSKSNHIAKEEIVEEITNFNVGLRKSSIFTLSFGPEPDYYFLEKLATRNGGFAKQIYDASDASRQLQDFYDLISCPVMTNVTFQYGESVTNLTETNFTTIFNGSEIVVAGRCEKSPNVTIEGIGANGKVTYNNPTIATSDTDIKRIWTSISITQLLEKATTEADKQKEFLQKAYDLALENAFATHVTSLVVPDLNNGTTVITPGTSKRGTRSVVSLPGSTPPPFIPKQEENSGCSSSILFSLQTFFSSTTCLIIFNILVY